MLRKERHPCLPAGRRLRFLQIWGAKKSATYTFICEWLFSFATKFATQVFWKHPDRIRFNTLIGKTGVLDHPLPIFVDHNIFLTINKVRWSDCSGEDWAKRAFFSHFTSAFKEIYKEPVIKRFE
jgi:hypothetical protein